MSLEFTRSALSRRKIFLLSLPAGPGLLEVFWGISFFFFFFAAGLSRNLFFGVVWATFGTAALCAILSPFAIAHAAAARGSIWYRIGVIVFNVICIGIRVSGLVVFAYWFEKNPHPLASTTGLSDHEILPRKKFAATSSHARVLDISDRDFFPSRPLPLFLFLLLNAPHRRPVHFIELRAR